MHTLLIMNIFQSLRHKSVILTLLFSSLFLTHGSFAQASNGDIVMRHIQFPGGSLEKFVEYFNSQNGTKPNLVVSPSAVKQEAELPSFRLEKATSESIALALRTLLPEEFKIETVQGASTGVLIRSISTISITVSYPTGPPRIANSWVTETIVIESLLSRFTAEEISDTISTAWQMHRRGPTEGSRLQYHPPTKLLIVAGPLDFVVLAQKTLSALKQSSLAPPPDSE